ncbi:MULTISPECIES: lipopolysaccharide core heptosyltransferase RfaQ [Providencia]|uniref:Lipopolysaccharide heptosyltransferase 3 n=2 Tax=Providencia rustigianii TaxID=158850 RepID=D1P7G8_9GAMM|nr:MULTISPECIES: lipopolysaccharide core heptosyltransferase RfaQ [Providencia]EFB70708.1 putative lipopolysaccharide heptosyltransferase III [Providencia rustigianii DSM 4541]MTC55712.1 lipopolysaccharide core heptosyltransferase RfaQ [Providencia rustigianii]MTC59533.1 lipopolysaccharide core heptosyltransferase RfaQ [Providencia rustigianii]SPY79361.1 Lipopolysaccharide core heptosyltransferase rfaQ [Providencia rustigianii]SUC29080.1 Lipopolysaccharide core heptosyltransferase rfaQ [Provid
MKKQFKKILVIKMRFHGDMLLTTPVISSLKQNYPDAQIDVLLYQDTIPILSENTDIHALYGMKGKKSGGLSKACNFLSLLFKLRSNKYDLVVNLADQWMVSLLVRAIPAEMKISHQFEHRDSQYWRNSFTHLTPPQGEHVVLNNLSVLKPLELKELNTDLTMSYAEQDWKNIDQKLLDLGVHSSYVVIQPTARQIFKCWDDEKFSAVIDALQSRGYQVVLTSGPSKDDLDCVNHIADGCKTRPITELAGKTSFPELGALIAHAALFIGVDSAPMHIAAAVKTPIVCLFGATNHIFWRPWSDNVVKFWAGDYENMPLRDDLDRNKKYLSVIPASDVIKATEQMLPMNMRSMMGRY